LSNEGVTTIFDSGIGELRGVGLRALMLPPPGGGEVGLGRGDFLRR